MCDIRRGQTKDQWNVRFGSKADMAKGPPDVFFTSESGHLLLSTSRGALGDDVDDLKGHHYFAGLINYLDKRGDRTAIGL